MDNLLSSDTIFWGQCYFFTIALIFVVALIFMNFFKDKKDGIK